MRKKKIIVCVTNDLVSDQRVHKVCMFLHTNNFDVELIGRLLPNSLSINRPYKTKRMNLLFKKGALFYINYNLVLFTHLLFKKHEYVLANDLDTLLACFINCKIKRKELFYDSHEYFTEVPELIDRPFIKKIWERIEQTIFPKLKKVYTVNESLATIFEKKYGIQVHSIMNLPYYSKHIKSEEKNIQFTVIYQGALNKDRGLEELILAFQYLENVTLWIVGEGDLSYDLRELSKSLKLNTKIKFWGKIPFEQLKTITEKAHLGVSLEKSTNLNYQLATPNKLFDYLAVGLPVLTSDLPEIKKIVENFQIGICLAEITPKLIASEIIKIKKDKELIKFYSKNAEKAHETLNWENQEEKLKKIFEC